MRVAVTDACIFIDLIECEVCKTFFKLPYIFITTVQVWEELEDDSHQILKPFVEEGKFEILKPDDTFIDETQDAPAGLSVPDRSIWFITQQGDRLLLTSDGPLRNLALENKIETHGLLWIFDQLAKENILKAHKCIEFLGIIFKANRMYRGNQVLLKEFEKLKRKWEGKGIDDKKMNEESEKLQRKGIREIVHCMNNYIGLNIFFNR